MRAGVVALLLLGTAQGPSFVLGEEPVSCHLAGGFSSSYGFRLVIPRGHQAVPSAVLGDHGVIISLGAEGSKAVGTMEFYGAFNALFYRTPEDAADAHVAWLREHAAQQAATVLSTKQTAVRGIRGVRVVTTYRKAESRLEMVSDEIEMLRSREGGDRLGDVPDYHYTFGLTAPASQYPAGKRLFERVLATVRFAEPDQ